MAQAEQAVAKAKAEQEKREDFLGVFQTVHFPRAGKFCPLFGLMTLCVLVSVFIRLFLLFFSVKTMFVTRNLSKHLTLFCMLCRILCLAGGISSGRPLLCFVWSSIVYQNRGSASGQLPCSL